MYADRCSGSKTEEMKQDKDALRDFNNTCRAKTGRVGCACVIQTSSTDPRPVNKQANMQTDQMKSSGGLNTPTEVRAMHPDCKYVQHKLVLVTLL